MSLTAILKWLLDRSLFESERYYCVDSDTALMHVTLLKGAHLHDWPPRQFHHGELISGSRLDGIIIFQDEALKQHQPIMVVGTPGRLAEHSRRGTLPTHRTGLLILDEVWMPSLVSYDHITMAMQLTISLSIVASVTAPP
eukprot:scaffold466839_cov24-Prasinocladus_malaysianus.AAC.1